MKLTTFIVLRIVPIFLMLASANAALFYYVQSSEIELGLTQEADAASVTLSEYLAANPDLTAHLRSPTGRSALAVTMAQMPGLKGITVLNRDGGCCLLQAGRRLERHVTAPRRAMQIATIANLRHATGDHYILSAIRLPRGELLVVETDADRMVLVREKLIWQIWLIVGAGGIAGLVVSLIIAGWLRTDLRTLRMLLASGSHIRPQTRFLEMRDLADSLLMLHRNMKALTELRKRSLAGST